MPQLLTMLDGDAPTACTTIEEVCPSQSVHCGAVLTSPFPRCVERQQRWTELGWLRALCRRRRRWRRGGLLLAARTPSRNQTEQYCGEVCGERAY